MNTTPKPRTTPEELLGDEFPEPWRAPHWRLAIAQRYQFGPCGDCGRQLGSEGYGELAAATGDGAWLCAECTLRAVNKEDHAWRAQRRRQETDIPWTELRQRG